MLSTLLLKLLVATLVGGTASYLGSLMIQRRMALVGDALGHVALPGMGVAFLLQLDPSLGAFVFLTLAIYFIWRFETFTELPFETVVGIIFVSGLAIGFLIIPKKELLESLVGELGRLTLQGTMVTIVLSSFVFVLTKAIYPQMILLGISQDLAVVSGVKRQKVNFLFLFAIALIVSIGVRVTGSLLVGALVIVPPAAAKLIGRNLKEYSHLSTIFGGICGFLGVLISHFVNCPPGPAIILTSSFFFLFAMILKRLLASPLHC